VLTVKLENPLDFETYHGFHENFFKLSAGKTISKHPETRKTYQKYTEKIIKR
jgi:hypothetical protein